MYMHSPTISPTFACNNSTISTTLSPQLTPQENKQSYNFIIQQKKMNTNHWCNKSASARFIEVVKREYRSNMELFNSINLYVWLEKSSVEKLGFLEIKNNNNKKHLGIIGSSRWQVLHKTNPKP